jgi:quinol monooxygenase YgiN
MSDEHPILGLVRDKVENPSAPFIIIARFDAQTGKGKDIVAAIKATKAIELTRQERECLGYDICRDADLPDRFTVYESWANLNGLREHLAKPHFAAVTGAISNLVAGPPSVRVMTSIHPDE